MHSTEKSDKRATAASFELPPSHAHPHDAADQWLVDEDLRLRLADGTEEHDPLAQLGLAVLDQLGGREPGEAMDFADAHPGDDARTEQIGRASCRERV